MPESFEPPKQGFRIEPPAVPKAALPAKPAPPSVKPMKMMSKQQDLSAYVPFIFHILAILAMAFFALTLWYLYIEWTGNPLPPYLRLPIAG
ncbi:MAG: hypothetical protein A3G33_05440 [Omnitrophica bacterium RIFCSPLOWO2_12_FULL_44_17]|uniref:Uncharacterized protein n=1 Tax=Candidatus Danuiimicrobium aquiferis TaxID=1801832 RepID=A0A1G1L0M9_9BACT|nr:MAG: hypothetical protein A3B72_04705 [Omnitrophica bacterium RIFCSPHIGHO2_02_FULL_45_28]OGW89866.1 MAG: hypothetical protein A3E74_07330 [Omnitrophica bacterium RIFCSPHIGHO2_12_FULL_44_12]OGW98717.1 MAG: hypothetical protein A3G33_05440 [Omnitrophica bacterium RIFCSPLOWO2_12_FULL_44_17]OGX03108.1 MAG: hypothetical protein A3J12_05845 [Omnitrophica bacterium RIFCSPLOWO2_02_FULL_44_11]